jgi:hypothetical protein
MEKPVRLRNKGKYIVICIAVVILCFAIKSLNDAGEFKSLVPHFEGECVSIPGVMGAEDITVLKTGQLLYPAMIDGKLWPALLFRVQFMPMIYSTQPPQLMDLTADVQF